MKNNNHSPFFKSALFYSSALFAVTLLPIVTPNLAFADQRAKIVIDADKETTDLIKGAVGETNHKPQSAYEARRSGEVAANYAHEALRSLGYYQADVVIEIADDDITYPTLKIDKGQQFKIKTPEIDWLETPPDEQTRVDSLNAIGLKDGAAGRADFVIAGESRAISVVLNHGYADAKLMPRRVIVDHSDYSVHPIYKIEAGERALLGEIIIQGKTRTKEKWLKKLVPWKVGDTYSTATIAEMQRRIIETGAYDSAAIRLGDKQDGTNIRDVNITLEDRAKITLETLASYSNSEGFSGEVRIGRYNMLGRGDSFINRILLGQIESRLETTLKLPHFKKHDQTLSLSAAAFNDDTDAYREQGIDLSGEVTRKFTPTSYWSLGVNANYARNREPSYYIANTNIDRNYWLFGISGTYMLDKTDNMLNPKKGYRADASLEPTIITGDANLSYVKMVAQAAYYKGLDKADKTIFATRMRIGSIAGGKIPEIPAARRLYVGGGGSVRGYAYQGIGPRYNDDNKTPIGGLSMVEMSVELRHQFANKFGVVAFVDAGTLGLEATPDFKEFKAGGGFGVRYDLGFAPVRLDIAVPFDKQAGDSSFQIYLGVGQSF